MRVDGVGADERACRDGGARILYLQIVRKSIEQATGAQVLDEGRRLIAPETGEDVTQHYLDGSQAVLEMAQVVGARKAYLKGGSPACDAQGVTGEILRRAGIEVIRVS